MYLHGYTDQESQRLVDQGYFLEPWIYPSIDFADCPRILEIGCGVGAQTLILRRRYPLARFTCVDRQESQLQAFRQNLAHPIAHGQVTELCAPGESLPLVDGSFDGVFICWLLEHVPEPQKILTEAMRVLKVGGKIYVTEVVNSSLITLPHLPYLHAYFEKVNQLQKSFGGAPNCGLRVPETMVSCGYRDLQVTPLPILLDGRFSVKQRTDFAVYWQSLLQSMEEQLLQQGLVTPWMVEQMQRELQSMIDHSGQIFWMAPIQVHAKK